MRRAARIDTTARALITKAELHGWKYYQIGGAIDGLLWHPWSKHVVLVDWKSSKKVRKQKDTMTPSQQKLVEAGWPIHFIETEQHLLAVLNDRYDDG
jgi:hypothetical protein